MPELPEVEVTRRGLAPHLLGHRIERAEVRHFGLRHPVDPDLPAILAGRRVGAVERRGKYLLIRCEADGAREGGWLMVHLGMTGTLRVRPGDTPVLPHDHFDLRLDSGELVRLRDPRRFGAVIWHPDRDGPVEAHPMLSRLGVEPLGPAFAGDAGGALLHAATRGRRAPIKPLLLAGQIVVGVGNIYASESLFRAGIHPATAAGRIGRPRYDRLAGAIRDTLSEAIARGGSTLRDFVGSDGASGYFQLDCFVYDRAGLPCKRCGTPIRQLVQGQRSTFYCPHCQHH